MNLISKKDLLAITGISYGQLYRWKRERLIPDEWFIKQSSYTGQETFFPREQILSRVQSILELKDSYSLEELAKILSPQTSEVTVSLDDLQEIAGIDQEIINSLPELYGKNQYGFLDVAYITAIVQTAKEAELTAPKTGELIGKSAHAASRLKSVDATCTVFLSDGEYHAVFTGNGVPVVFDGSIEEAGQSSVSEIADKIRINYKNIFLRK